MKGLGTIILFFYKVPCFGNIIRKNNKTFWKYQNQDPEFEIEEYEIAIPFEDIEDLIDEILEEDHDFKWLYWKVI